MGCLKLPPDSPNTYKIFSKIDRYLFAQASKMTKPQNLFISVVISSQIFYHSAHHLPYDLLGRTET